MPQTKHIALMVVITILAGSCAAKLKRDFSLSCPNSSEGEKTFRSIVTAVEANQMKNALDIALNNAGGSTACGCGEYVYRFLYRGTEYKWCVKNQEEFKSVIKRIRAISQCSSKTDRSALMQCLSVQLNGDPLFRQPCGEGEGDDLWTGMLIWWDKYNTILKTLCLGEANESE